MIRIEPDSAAEVLSTARRRSGMTKSAFAKAARTSRSALDQYEQGNRVPRYDTLMRTLRAVGYDIEVGLRPRYTATDVANTSLAAFFAQADAQDPLSTWRLLISDFAANEFVPASTARRAALLRVAPAATGNSGWDAFAAALGEHLAFHAGIKPPSWVFRDNGFQLDHFWWPVHGELASMRSAAAAHSPASFKRRLVLIDGREVPRVRQ